MDADLFFIPMLAKALEEQEAGSAMRIALDRIKQAASDERLYNGWRNFVRFTAECQRIAAQYGPDLETEALEAVLGRTAPIQLLLRRDGQNVDTMKVRPSSERLTCEGLVAGRYTLATDTGWVVWDESLTDDDLLWHRVHVEEALPLAAETHSTELPSHTIALPHCGLQLSVYPGLESGTLELTLMSLGAG